MAAPKAFSRTTWVVLLAVASAAIIAIICSRIPEQAEVTGRKPADRVAEICRVADEQLKGAGDAIAAAAEDKDPTVRRASLVALSKFIDPKYRSLVETGAGDSDPRVRSAAARTLGLYDDDKAIIRLGELVSQDPDEQVRLAAIQALGRTKGDRGVILLADTADSNDNPKVKKRAVEVLMRKLKIRFRSLPDPKDSDPWSKVVKTINEQAAVLRARARTSSTERN